MAVSAVFSRTVVRQDDGALAVGGADVRALAGQYGTPLYVIDEHDMRGRARAFRDEFAAAFGAHGAEVDVFYASKAFLSSKVAKWMHEDGLFMDVASGGELEIALRGGCPPHGSASTATTSPTTSCAAPSRPAWGGSSSTRSRRSRRSTRSRAGSGRARRCSCA
ncbi:hypothetical protein GCM10025873_28500 [Demequina sediminis]|nr:hypothetical protein GCM10025873_00710 [Demequina sediminis]BDZ63059.1 hypothetical protein GCM10025873_28500 [Demequina sediminis]